jgi:SAM-dependent methyltransferase
MTDQPTAGQPGSGQPGAGKPSAGKPSAGKPSAEDRIRLFGILSSPWLAQCCYALADLGLADLMAAGPRPVAELAAGAGADERALHRMLRALTAAGLVAEAGPGCFGLTPVTQLLRSDVFGSSRDTAVMFGEEVFRSFAEITHTLRTGQPAFEKVYGQPFYDYLGGNPAAARTFGTAMGGAGVPAVLTGCDLAGLRTVVDVGGGDGGLLIRVLRAQPQARGVLVDLPAAAAQARERLGRAGLADRVDFVEASFFDEMPAGADAYVLCRVLHNWPDEDAVRLLQRIRKVMAPDGRIIVVEDLVHPATVQNKSQDEAAQPAQDGKPQPAQDGGSQSRRAGAEIMDLLILVMLSGCDRTESEYTDLLGRAGLRVSAVHPPPRGRSVESAIEAVPA